MRLVFVTTSIDTGGAEAMLAKLVIALDKARFSCFVIVLAGRTPLAEEMERAGVTVVTLDLLSRASVLVVIWRVLRAVRTLAPDLLQGWMLHGNLAAQLSGTLLRVPVLWGIRYSKLVPFPGNRVARVLAWLMRYLSALAERVVYNSTSGKSHHETLGYPTDKSVVIPNGFDVTKFAPDESARLQQRRALGVDSRTVVVGMVARYHPMKDHLTLLKAAQVLRRTQADLLFVLVGRHCDSDNAALVQEIRRLGLSDVVALLGERRDVHLLANAFDIGVLSSISEGFPNVVGELMACGVPCVTTDVGDCALLVGDTGVSTAPADPLALAKALEQIFELGDEGRRKLGQRARTRIADHFSIDLIARRFESLYSESVSPRTLTTR